MSVDGLRQDFVVLEKPAGQGELRVGLAVAGARVEAMPGGARLVLEKSGRRIAYSRLRVMDATGRELSARMEVQSSADFRVCRIAGFQTRTPLESPRAADWEIGDTAGLEPCATALAVLVEDAGAVYPLRIDPTFSDANWISMNPSILGADGNVYAAMLDGSGNLYIGGHFTVVGDVVANCIAKWDESSWSTLASGINGSVSALAVSGGDLYAGGGFTTAGGVSANRIAKWDGSSWSALGSGMNQHVLALAVSGSDVYAGGWFTIAGGKVSAYVARALLNGCPIADASATPTLVVSPNGANAYVVLDGPRSSDPDGDPLSYTWFWSLDTRSPVAPKPGEGGSTPIATGMVAVVSLPVGTNLIELLVDDGMAQDTDTVSITVLTAE